MAKAWKKSETEYLKRYASSKTTAELAQRFDTDVVSVGAKVQELGLTTKDTVGGADDPVVARFGEAVTAMGAQRWAEAEKGFEGVIQDGDPIEVAERARQYLIICRERSGKAGSSAEGDPYLEAVVLKNQGRLVEALERAKGVGGDDDRSAYLTASIHALAGRLDEARADLERAIELNPRNRVHSYHDPDYAALREHEEHASLWDVD